MHPATGATREGERPCEEPEPGDLPVPANFASRADGEVGEKKRLAQPPGWAFLLLGGQQ